MTKIRTEIKIWSSIGNTPLTGRGKCFCDLLLDTVIEIEKIEEARNIVKKLIKDTKSGYKGSYFCPEYWNKNKNIGFVSL